MTSRPMLLALGVLACHGGDSAEEVPAPRVPVSVVEVRRDTISETLNITGRLVSPPGGSAVLSAPADAVVRSVAVQTGARVSAGTLLVDLESPELVTRAAELRAAARVAEQDAARQRELLAQGITSAKQAAEREAAAEGARAEAEAAERLLARAHVTSPLAGAVQRILVQPGERVQSGQLLVEVIGAGAVDFTGPAPAAQLGRVRVGQPARVRVEGTAESLSGRVYAIAPGVDSLTNAGTVVIRLDRGGPAARVGSAATATLTLVTHEGLVVPDSALVLVRESLSLLVVGPDSVAHVRPVTVGIRSGSRAEVAGTIQAGELVVSVGAYGVADSTRVIPMRQNHE